MKGDEEHQAFKVLMERVRRRETDAIRELCQKYRPIVEKVAGTSFRQKYQRYLGLSDLEQEGLIAIMQNADKILEQSDIPGYITIIARNLLLRSMRFLHAQKRDIDRVEADGQRIDEEYREAASASQLASQAEEIARAIAPLKDIEVAVFWAYLSGYSYSEIGDMLGLTEEACRRIVAVAYELIRSK